MTTLGLASACSILQITAWLGKKPSKVQAPSQAGAVGEPPRVTQAASTATAGAGESQAPITQVTLITRAQWGALEPSVTPDGFGEHGPYDPITNPSGWRVYDQPLETVLTEIIIHHSALPLTDGPREIQRLHTEEKGFADIGYHFLIDDKGQLFEGRSLQVRGAHTYGANDGTLGICVLGNFEEIQPSKVQLAVLKIVLADLVSRFPKISHLAGHKDHNPGVTLCPGANLYPLLPGLAKEQNLRYGV